MNILMLMMGGKGTRFGADIPKQYITIHNKPVFYYIIEKYLKCPDIHGVVLVSHEDWISFVKEQLHILAPSIPCHVVPGGQTRSESVLNGLKEAMELGKGTTQNVVLIHDATHPYVDIPTLIPIIEAVKEYGGATLGGCQYDTMYQTSYDGFIEDVIPRQQIFSGASPEAFRLEEIYSIYCNASKEELDKMTSAGALALSHKIPMKVIPTNLLNLKITHGPDMKLFELLLHYFFTE